MEVDPAYVQRLAELGLQSRVLWGLSALSLLTLLWFAARCGSRFAVGEVPARFTADALHRCRSATASMEFLLVLFPFLIMVMTVWQLAFMFNARLHVGYAAFAAARSAAVLIPAEYQGEKEGVLQREAEPNATKWKRIRRAAIPGTIAVSPGDMEAAAGTAALAALGGGKKVQIGAPDIAVLPRLTLMGLHYYVGGSSGPQNTGVFSGTRPQRTLVKDLYAQQMTQVLVNGQDNKKPQSLKTSDTVTVTVNYVFWLQVPYVGRLLEAMFKGFMNPITGEPIFRNPFPSMQITETVTMVSWRRKRSIEPG